MEPDTFEREMSRHQRSLVDTCLEEGQYESAISVLDQLRSSKYRPAAFHIRQLLYIALYPPAPATDDKGKGRADPVSPRKAAKQQKYPLFPSAAASSAAQRLLLSFAYTNSPSGIFRALPSYSATTGDSTSIGRDWGGKDEEDSYIAREAMRVKDSKDCWSILRPGFIQRKQPVISPSKGKGKRRARDDFEEDSDEHEEESQTIVAEHAWPVLDWFLHIFEQDELSTENAETPRYSPLLVSQIPSSRNGWETDAPLDIVFHCLQHIDQRRRVMGARLMTLLINLTSTIYLDMPMFVTSIVSRLSLKTIDEFSALFSSLAPSTVIIRFKVALCQRYINHASFDGETVPEDSRPKPQARVQPRAVHAARRNAAEDSGSPAKSTETTAITRKHGLPPSSEVLRLIEKNFPNPKPSSSVILFFRAKFELLVAYGIAQEKATVDNKDPEWSTMLHDGRMADALNIAFTQQDEAGRVYRESLLNIIATW